MGSPKFCDMYNEIFFYVEESKEQNATKRPHIIAPPALPVQKGFSESTTDIYIYVHLKMYNIDKE